MEKQELGVWMQAGFSTQRNVDGQFRCTYLVVLVERVCVFPFKKWAEIRTMGEIPEKNHGGNLEKNIMRKRETIRWNVSNVMCAFLTNFLNELRTPQILSPPL